jgi:hypothetical protein
MRLVSNTAKLVGYDGEVTRCIPEFSSIPNAMDRMVSLAIVIDTFI